MVNYFIDPRGRHTISCQMAFSIHIHCNDLVNVSSFRIHIYISLLWQNMMEIKFMERNQTPEQMKLKKKSFWGEGGEFLLQTALG